MQRQLAEIVNEFEHAQARLDKLTDTLPEDRWSVRSEPDRWSAAECVAHLNLTSAAYIPRIRVAVAEARRLGQVKSQKYRRDPVGWMLSGMVGPVPLLGRYRIGKVRTPASFIPSGNPPRQVVIAEFRKHQDELIAMAVEADGMPIDKVWITSPFAERVRYNCYSAFMILPRHQERHLDQAEAAGR